MTDKEFVLTIYPNMKIYKGVGENSKHYGFFPKSHVFLLSVISVDETTAWNKCRNILAELMLERLSL